MKQTSENRGTSEQVVKDIHRATRKQYSAEEKIRIVLDGLRGEYSIAELCRREGIAESLYYSWSKEFLEAGKRRLSGDIERSATGGERAAAIYSLIETTKLNNLDPEAYLRSVLTRVADHPINRITELLPWNFGAKHASHQDQTRSA